MRATEPLRLALVGFFFVLIQLAFYTEFPQWRAGIDIYVAFLLLVTATRGPLMASAYALGGGLLMDSFSTQAGLFHTVYYFSPVLVGSMLRSYMLVEFKLLGALTVMGLLLLKILAFYFVAVATGTGVRPGHLLTLNYWPLLVISIAVLLAWPWMVRVIPTTKEVRKVGF